MCLSQLLQGEIKWLRDWDGPHWRAEYVIQSAVWTPDVGDRRVVRLGIKGGHPYQALQRFHLLAWEESE